MIDFTSNLLLGFVKDEVKSKKILIIKIDGIGDFLLFLPFFKIIKDNYSPPYKISACLINETKILAENIRVLDEIIVVDLNKFENNLFYRFNFLKNLKKAGFEKAIYPAYSRISLGDQLIKYSFAKEKIASDSFRSKMPEQQIKKNNMYYTSLIHQTNKPMHEIERNIEFLNGLGLKFNEYKITINASDNDEVFAKNIINNHDYIIIFPGARVEKRKWDINNFIKIADYINKKYKYKIIVIGGPSDTELGKKIKEKLKDQVFDMTKKTNLIQLFALMKKSKLFIGNDSSGMHFASAAGIPIIEISCHPLGGKKNHPNSPVRFGPYKTRNIVLQPLPDNINKDFCKEETSRFINTIKPGQVIEAIDKILI